MDSINSRNVENIRYQIGIKKETNPYWSSSKTNKNVITDYDTFPYTRYFRGDIESDIPIISEREAGWRPRNEDCYNSDLIREDKNKKHHDIVRPRNYFQPACSVVYPKYINPNDISLTDVKLNENCVMSYR